MLLYGKTYLKKDMRGKGMVR